MVSLFTAGGIIVDTAVTADGLVGPRTMGGNAVYSAAGARLWTDAVGIVGIVPRNYPRDFLDRLGAAGIDLAGVATARESVEEAEWFFYRADGSRADHLHAPMAQTPVTAGTRLLPAEQAALENALRASTPAGSDFASFRRRHPVRMEDVPAHFRRARGAHLAANRPQEQLAMAQTLRASGLIVTVDPGSNALAFGAEGLGAILAAATAFLPSEKELAIFAPGRRAADGLERLRGAGCGIGVAKLGADGAMLLGPVSGPRSIPAIATEALDPTGAGDAFCGGFLAGLVLTGDPLAAACLATVSASFAVEDFGPFHLLAVGREEASGRLAAFVDSLDPGLSGDLRPILSHMDIT